MKDKVISSLHKLRDISPLVHHITNSVTINDCANITLAIGASPVMADDESEVKEMVNLSKALVLNIGTLNARTVESMLIAGKEANKIGIPIVLDPVGAGATSYRTMWAQRLFEELNISVIRGNASEIMAMSGLTGNTKGVDSSSESDAAITCAKELIEFKPCTVAITGAVDIVLDESRELRLKNGTKMMKQVTGTGCMASSLTGSFCASGVDSFLAAASALTVIGIAGELAECSLKNNEGIGTFRTRLFDYVHTMDANKINLYMEALENEKIRA
jgi:hydroxyethylthiazole kinase